MAKSKPPFENIEPWPNPKMMTVERVEVALKTEDGKTFGGGTAYIRNASIHPAKAVRGSRIWRG